MARMLDSFGKRLRRDRRRKDFSRVAAQIQVVEPRALLAGVVSSVVTAAGDLKITGSASADEILIESDGTDITIKSLNGTTINGSTADVVAAGAATGGRDVVIMMKGGNDRVLFHGLGDTSIGRNLKINMNGGNDFLFIGIDSGVLSVGGAATVVLGAGNDTFVTNADAEKITAKSLSVTGGAGTDLVCLSGISVDSNATINTGAGHDAVGAADVSVGVNLKVITGGGDDRIAVDGLSVSGSTTIVTGAGSDQVNLENADLQSSVLVNLGAQEDDLKIGAVTTHAGVALNGAAGLADAITAGFDDVAKQFESHTPVTATADDICGLISPDQFPNDEPTAELAGNQTVNEDAGAQIVATFATLVPDANFPGELSEAGQTVLAYTVTNTNPTLFSAAPAIAVDGTLTYTPAADTNGTTTVTVVVQDDGGTANGGDDTSSATLTFVITVSPVNDEPTATLAGDPTATSSSPVAQAMTGFATLVPDASLPGDASENGQTATYSVTNDNNSLFSSQPAIAADGTLTYTPALFATGMATVSVIVQDDGGLLNGGDDTSATLTFTITIALA